LKNILYLSGILFFLAGCKKEITELPSESSTGANTFGALVNNAFWIPKGFGIVPTAPILEARYGLNNAVLINARNFASSPKESEFEILLNNVTGPGVYVLNDEGGSGNYAYYVERKLVPHGEWRTNAQNTGQVVISVADTINRIIAGRFEFVAASLTIYGAAPVHVTEGRFDIKIK
jgi:hypothetical protein